MTRFARTYAHLFRLPLAIGFTDKRRALWGLAERIAESSRAGNMNRRVRTDVLITFNDVPDKLYDEALVKTILNMNKIFRDSGN